MKTLTITKKPKTKHGKTREFSAAVLGWLVADDYWDSGSTGNNEYRPLWLSLVGSETALRTFVANIQMGNRAKDGSQWVKILKSANYETVWQRSDVQDNHICTIWQPEPFALSPGLIDPEYVRFVSAPPLWWVGQEAAKIRDDHNRYGRIIDHINRMSLWSVETPVWASERTQSVAFTEDGLINMVPLAVHFTAMIDRRTRNPIVNDERFALQLYIAAIVGKLAEQPNGSWGYHGRSYDDIFDTYNWRGIGMAVPTGMAVTHERLDAFLATKTRLWSQHYG